MGKKSLYDRASQFEADGVVNEDDELMCRYCGKKLANSKFQIEQHLKTTKHKENFKMKCPANAQTRNENDFSRDLCRFFLACDIPLHKLNHPACREFMSKWCRQRVPGVSSVREKYVDDCYNLTIDMIRREIGDHPIWVSIDETAGAGGRFIANVVVGALRVDSPSRPFLLHLTHLEHTNSMTVAECLDEALSMLWPDRIQHEKLFALITDATAHMIRAADDLRQTLYPRMLHVTCFAHALHNVADFIRNKYRNADALVNHIKKVFLKAHRVQLLKIKYPDLCLPPAPVIAQSCSWLLAVRYFAEEWNRIKDVIESLDDDAAILEAKKLFANPETFFEISEVYQKYMFLPASIVELEGSGKLASTYLLVIKRVLEKIAVVGTSDVKKKLSDVLNRNSGLVAIEALIKGDVSKLRTFKQFENASPAEIAKFAYLPLILCDVEKNFGQYKQIFRANLRNFTLENLKKHLVVACNSNDDNSAEENSDDFTLHLETILETYSESDNDDENKT